MAAADMCAQLGFAGLGAASRPRAPYLPNDMIRSTLSQILLRATRVAARGSPTRALPGRARGENVHLGKLPSRRAPASRAGIPAPTHTRAGARLAPYPRLSGAADADR